MKVEVVIKHICFKRDKQLYSDIPLYEIPDFR
jgi:hypothetical protein